ncbi:tripartite motif-containing protein 72-like [Polyodon spathula]|uniref:tripartite motif-containing protein 72-like n=1 Tax=Polyodon spathula TaxID=7913 RepID=UPI001B7F528E|nr:tripartite motif-containing protein 72-like [Polyodon spathula]
MAEEEEDDLNCPACQRLYHVPLLLPCSHSLCRSCVLRMTADSQKPPRRRALSPLSCTLDCPRCLFSVELPSPDLGSAPEYLPVNPALQDALDRHVRQAECRDHGANWRLFFCERTQRLVCRTCRPRLLEEDCVVTLEDAWESREEGVLRGLQGIQDEMTTLKQELRELEGMTLEETPAAGVSDAEQRVQLARERLQSLAEYSSRLTTALEEQNLARLLLAATQEPLEFSASQQQADSPRDPVQGSVELSEEDMERFRQGVSFKLDPHSAHPSLRVSPTGLTVHYLKQGSLELGCSSHGDQTGADAACSSLAPCVLADINVDWGLCYWEVDVCNSRFYRIGVSVWDGSRSWWLCREGSSFSALYDGAVEVVESIPPQVKTLGVCLNHTGGTLSFHNALAQEHIVTLPTSFGGVVRPALSLSQGKLTVRCGLPVPPHVFASRRSAYRGARGAGERWTQDVPFQPVLSFIQKFEELSATDSDSGLVSTFGSSSTLNSWSSSVEPSVPGNARGGVRAAEH